MTDTIWFVCGHCHQRVRWRKPAHFVTMITTGPVEVERNICCSTDCAAALEDKLMRRNVLWKMHLGSAKALSDGSAWGPDHPSYDEMGQ